MNMGKGEIVLFGNVSLANIFGKNFIIIELITMDQYEGIKIDWLNKALVASNVVCQKCGNLTDNKLIPIAEMYPHDGGLLIKGNDEKQWIYYKCECGQQNTLFALLQSDGSDLMGQYFAEVFRNARIQAKS